MPVIQLFSLEFDSQNGIELMNTWPNDVDGDVLRRLDAHHFDFSKPSLVDFNIDFEHWPPKPEAIEVLKSHFSSIELVNPDDDFDDGGYVLICIEDIVSYELVINTQNMLTELMRPFGGWCESWGVMSD